MLYLCYTILIYTAPSFLPICIARRSRRLLVAARRIQCNYRAYIHHKSYKHILYAIYTIQRCTRGMQARITYQLLRRQKPTLRIQTWYRCYSIYNIYKQYKHAVIILQSRYKARKARLLYTQIRYNNRIIILQAYIRRLICRYKYKKYVYSIVVLQSGHRRCMAKKQLIALRIEAKGSCIHVYIP